MAAYSLLEEAENERKAPLLKRSLAVFYPTVVYLFTIESHVYAMAIAASVLLGDVTFRLVEAPFMNLKTWSWRSAERKAVFRRAAWWLPSRVVKRMPGTTSAPPPAAAEPTPESAVGAAEPSASRMSPTGS